MSRVIRPEFNRVTRLLVSLIMVALALVGSAEGAGLTVQWDSNRESDVTGYLIAYGTQSDHLGSIVDVGNHTTYQLVNLEAGRTYFITVQAYNRTGLISAPSTVVSATVGVAQLTLTNLIANVMPPRPVGTTVIFAAAASGGVAPYQYKWFVSDGSNTVRTGDWSSDNTFTWQPSAASQNYAVKAWARSATNTADAPDNANGERTMPFPTTSASTTVIKLVSDREAPQPRGTRIVFTATATGGPATYEFQWSVFDGASWKVVQDWSTNGTLTWTPTTPNPNYQVMARVRGGQNLAANAGLTIPFPVQ
jgi:hypothetical protein